MSLSSIYSTIQLYVQIYTRTHSYIKDGHEIPPNVFHLLFSHKSIISMHKCFVTTFIKTIHNFRNHDNLELNCTKENGGGIFRNLNIMWYTHSVLTHNAVHLLCNVLQNNLIPHTHCYLIYGLRKFLRIFILVYPALNTAINWNMSYRASNIWVSPFSSQSMPSTGLCMIILKPSDGKSLLTTIGHTYA